MRRFSVFIFVLVVSVTSARGQVVASHSSPGPEAVRPIATTFHSNVSTIDGCPVGLLADRRSDLAMVRIGETHESGPAQGLHIRLFSPRIVTAEITVYGVTTQASILPVGAASNEISKTFALHPGEGRKGSQEATVWMHQVGALTRVELNSLTYADGSVWHESEGSRCRAVPSAFLLVGEK
jgi:hypothetical protein